MKLPIMLQSLSLCLIGYTWFGQASSRSLLEWSVGDLIGCSSLRTVVEMRLTPELPASFFVAVIAVGHGRSPLKALFAPLVAAFDALLGVMSGNIERCPLVVARCHLPAFLCMAKHGRLVASGALGGDAMQLL
jgi:hypothetical protein